MVLRLKLFLLSLTCLFVHASQVSAQTRGARMEIRAEIMSTLQVEAIKWGIELESDLLVGSPRIDPADDSAAHIRFRATPGQFLSVNLPEQVHLESDHGRIRMVDLEILVGSDADPGEMRSVTPQECTRLEIPSNGTLYMRIGGLLQLEEYLMEGLYHGELTLETVCVEE